jgi:hypothetical protein
MANYPLIQDKQPDSWQEVYFANALAKYDIPFYFQWAIGNPTLRGAVIVDFVTVNPFYQPIEIFGRHWHEGQLGADDRLKLSIEEHYFKRAPIVIWSDEIETQELANKYVKAKIL